MPYRLKLGRLEWEHRPESWDDWLEHALLAERAKEPAIAARQAP